MPHLYWRELILMVAVRRLNIQILTQNDTNEQIHVRQIQELTFVPSPPANKHKPEIQERYLLQNKTAGRSEARPEFNKNQKHILVN